MKLSSGCLSVLEKYTHTSYINDKMTSIQVRRFTYWLCLTEERP